MQTLELPWIVGDHIGKLSIVQPNGNGNTYFQILVDRMYQGQLIKTPSGYHFYLNGRSVLTGYETRIILEAITGW